MVAYPNSLKPAEEILKLPQPGLCKILQARFRERRACELRRITLPRTPVNKGVSKAGDLLWSPRYSMESDFAEAYPYAAMIPVTILAITTRTEHWATSLITSLRESSSSFFLSPSISSMSTDLIYTSPLTRWDRRVKWCASRSRVCLSSYN